MAQQQFLERDPQTAVLEPERTRTQPADRPGGHFEHEHAVAIHAALGVNGTVVQPESCRRRRDGVLDPALPAGIAAGRRDVDRLFEEGSLERIRLVEDRQHPQPAMFEHPSIAYSSPGM